MQKVKNINKKSGADHTVKGIKQMRKRQYLERQCLFSSGCYKLWLSKAGFVKI